MLKFVLQVSERWESPCSQLVELVLQEHNFFLLLLDHVHQPTLVSDFFDLLAWVAIRTIVRV